jgi:type II secretory pathway component PulJ
MELFLALSIIAFIAVVTIDTLQQRRQRSFHAKDFSEQK